MDSIEASGATEAGKKIDAGGLELTERATIDVGLLDLLHRPYREQTINRDTIYRFNLGCQCSWSRRPTAAAMQAYSRIVDKTLNYDDLATLGARLKLPSGWRYTTTTPDQDLVLGAQGKATVKFRQHLSKARLTWMRSRLVQALVLFVVACAASEISFAADQKEREFQECSECPVMVGIPAGTFTMGSPQSESGRFDSEGPQHKVEIKAFAFGKFDVTSEQFLTFLKETGHQPAPCNAMLDMRWHSPGHGLASPPFDADLPRWPAVCLDWRDAERYIDWVNAKVRAEHPATAREHGPYRLPTEAEWEYAARAGTTTARWWGDAIGTSNANCNGCGSPWDNRILANVDSFRPNPFGLYGMLGNAWQWTADCWHQSYVGAPADGSAWSEPDCGKRVMRGGSWSSLPVFIRSAARSGTARGDKDTDYSSLTGFRVARDLP